MNYKRSQKQADQLIRKYADGQTATVIYPAERVGGSEFNPEYGDPLRLPGVPAVLLPITTSTTSAQRQFGFNSDTMIPGTTGLIYIAGVQLPTDRQVNKNVAIEIGADTYYVTGSELVAPSGLPILYQIQVKR